MDFDDYLEPEVAVTAAVTAAVFSPQARKLLRRGAIYSMAGILIAREKISLLTHNVAQGFRDAQTSSTQQQHNTKHGETIKDDESTKSSIH